jgi:KDO2-lipid IV(A) lauroyltransferase
LTVLQPSDSALGRFLFRLSRRGTPLFPLALARALSLPPADLAYAVWASKRRYAAQNFAQVTGLAPDDPRVRRLVRDCFRHFGLYVAEIIHLHGWDTQDVLDRVDIEGEDNFAAAAAHGRGIVFVSGHMGSTEVAASLAVLRGYQIRAITEPLSSGILMDWLIRTRRAMGVTLTSPDGAGLGLIRTLRRGGMVAMLIDAGIDHGGGVTARFFGRPTAFPDGPARLARLTGAPLVFGLAVRRPRGRFRAFVCPPLLPDRDSPADADVARMTQALATTLEGFVRRYPAQWYAFRPIWPGAANGGVR